ncbi:hypothetical protein C2869_02085 [Saccharobesus litoralis]|uniref:Permuted papain-like amidase enzyme, YaeF/YiiX, C92 family n=1 Tax=Saccharobesus litoralis TaxID=2172099 RepID=A0A2S0VM70_9ALTE|nr:YiiX/YebB-like N1pC/P60 family cysteine hydrolase [Saccharobesus litoralis]AWB65305.1 hypothetical protein C2869_02085 [Saccharobesus litoralis]
MDLSQLTPKLKSGDIIFTSIPNVLYQAIEQATQSPTSHVGLVLNIKGQWMVAESRVPLSCYTPLEAFIHRSKNHWFSVKRLPQTLSASEIATMQQYCEQHLNEWYGLGFNYDSDKQFCSKFVFDAYRTALHVDIGQLKTFEQLLTENPNTPLLFWKLWFLGCIPWHRQTITPQSMYLDPKLLDVA